ncbi:GFA family protein [Pseudomonas sp. GD03944]|uniref:GFA family protein n=1 Tax=Pseudomonas sp. GD03944 TaxID=2975409 RepID=UPI0024478308|nr:GFA family protein [Pseudomonas sp. GD03944]MDH1262742.1 GFA family protein [Pseudomonas sp. GD03944]
MVTLPLFGGCACGQVRYRLDALPGDTGYCHCRTCQRCAAAPAVPWAMVPAQALHYLSGDVGIFRSSEHGERRFCRDCGTYLEYREQGYAEIGLSSVTLDHSEWFPPQKHIWFASRVPWFEPADDLPRFDQGE